MNTPLNSYLSKSTINGYFIKQDLPYITRFIGDNVKFYTTDVVNKRDILNNIKRFGLTYKSNDNSLSIIDGDILYIILFEWIGLKEVLPIIQSMFDNNTTDGIKKSNMIKMNIDRSLLNSTDEFSEIIRKFKNVKVTEKSIELYDLGLEPTKAISDNIIVDIPNPKEYIINNIKVFTDPMGCIVAVKLDNLHPNADNLGWFCLGELKLMKLNLTSFDKLLNKIKIFNLRDCYWIPDFIQQNKESESACRNI